MINLLPEQQKRQLLAEYRIRIWVTSLFLFCCVALISIALLIPSLVVSMYQQQAAQAKDDVVEKTVTASHAELVSQVASLSIDLSVLTPSATTTTSAITLINTVLADRGTIKISSIGYTAGSPSSLTVEGVASSRDDLAAFADRLKHEGTLSVVNLPASNLAQDSNVSFGISVKSLH